MPESFYRSGQAARQLGVSSYHVRRLCETGEITAELTSGQQWRIPESELVRLRREGIPDIPVGSEAGEEDSGSTGRREADLDEFPDGLLATPSEDLIEAAEEVKIVESRLKKRRIEKDAEEVEDWFRDRSRRQAAVEAGERQVAEAARAVQQRKKWLDSWISWALSLRPYGVPQEASLDIHQAVQAALANLDPGQADSITRRIVEGAVAKAIRPWKRKHDMRMAVQVAMNRLPWDVAHRAEWAERKQQALGAATAAVAKLPADVTSSEMQDTALLAVQPVVKEHDHQQTCQRMALLISLVDIRLEDITRAREAVAEALVELPVGTPEKELEKAREAALEPFRAATRRRTSEAQSREGQKRRETEAAGRRASIERRVDRRLSDHVDGYLQELGEDEIEFEDDDDRLEMGKDLTQRIRPALLKTVLGNPEMSNEDIDEEIEVLVDRHKQEFLDD